MWKSPHFLITVYLHIHIKYRSSILSCKVLALSSPRDWQISDRVISKLTQVISQFGRDAFLLYSTRCFPSLGQERTLDRPLSRHRGAFWLIKKMIFGIDSSRVDGVKKSHVLSALFLTTLLLVTCSLMLSIPYWTNYLLNIGFEALCGEFLTRRFSAFFVFSYLLYFCLFFRDLSFYIYFFLMFYLFLSFGSVCILFIFFSLCLLFLVFFFFFFFFFSIFCFILFLNFI